MGLGHLLRRLNNQYSLNPRYIMQLCERSPCQLVSLCTINKWEVSPVNLQGLKG